MGSGDAFSTRISLDGGQEIINQLQQIGATGEKTFAAIKAAVAQPNPALLALSNSINQSRIGMQQLGTQIGALGQAIAPFSSHLAGLTSLFSSFSGTAGVLGAVAALGFFVKSAADAIVQADRTSKALGLTATQFKTLKDVAKAAGIDSDQLTTALTRFAARAAEEGKQQFDALIKGAELLGRTIQGQNFSNPSIIRVVGDIQKINEQIAIAAPKFKALLDEAATPGRPAASLQQITLEARRLANQGDATGEVFRKILRDIGSPLPAASPLENLGNIAEKAKNSLTSLGISFLDASGKQLNMFESLKKTTETLAKMPDGLQKTALEAQIFGRAIGPQLADAFQKADLPKILAEIERLKLPLTEADKAALEAGVAFQKALNDLDDSAKKTGGSLLVTFGPALTAAINEVGNASSAFGDHLEALRNAKISDLFTLDPKAKASWDDFFSFWGPKVNFLIEKAKEAAQFLKGLFSGLFSGPSSNTSGLEGFSGVVPGLAGGGMVFGPGTATSDSILTRLSRGEFVEREAAVRYYGADFMHALNQLRIPRDVFRGFSMGGMIDNMHASLARNFAFPDIPAFASGGMVGGGGGLHPVTINFAGQRIGGLMAPPDVVKQLRKAAVLEQLTSTGRK